MRMVVDTYLPRSSTLARSYFKVRIDVLKDVSFSDFTLFQLGSDYYNESDTSTISWGSSAGRAGSAEPPSAQHGRVEDKIRLDGRSPWVALHELSPETEKQTAAVRGAIVRDYRAVIDGKQINELWLSPSRAAKNLAADLTLPSSVDRFQKGDQIEFLLDLVVVPSSADFYYGTDTDLRKQLAAMTNIWEQFAREAQDRDTQIDGKATLFPATVEATSQPRSKFTVKSFSTMDTVRLTGLRDPSIWTIGELHGDDWLPLGERFPAEGNPQLNYDPLTDTWTAVLSLIFPSGGGSREFEYRLNE